MPSTESPAIKYGDFVMLELPKGIIRGARLDAGSSLSAGKQDRIPSDALVGKMYGLEYELVDGRLIGQAPKTITEIEITNATNELIYDGQSVQGLTIDDIEALKESGVHASDIIEKQIKTHASYALKNEHSKEKYKKRKEAKFMKSFKISEPTLLKVCEYWHRKHAGHGRDFRTDTIAQMLTMANVRPGGRCIVVESVSGLLVAGVLERLGGSGCALIMDDINPLPDRSGVTSMNFDSSIFAPVISLTWLTATTDEISSIPVPETFVSERQRSRVEKRMESIRKVEDAKAELAKCDFDSLLVSSHYDPVSIVGRLFPHLAPSASIVVHSPHVQTLSQLHAKMKQEPSWLGITVTESWLRPYQVLPGRTHPVMTMSGTGGYLLHAIKIVDTPSQ